MMNLKGLEKKLYFKIILHVFIFTVIGFGIVALSSVIDTKEMKFHTERDSIIKTYNKRIIYLDSIDSKLKVNQSILQHKIDSLEGKKNIINVDYDKKIKSIYDASAIEHALWMDSIIKKLNNNKR